MNMTDKKKDGVSTQARHGKPPTRVQTKKEKKRLGDIQIIILCIAAVLGLGALVFAVIIPRLGTSSDRELRQDRPRVEIDVADFGVITLELDPSQAPNSVDNFIEMVNEGFYDGLTFHRIISNFMMQGGDPNGDGTGGSGRNIKGEFVANGVENTISHVRGTVSMARADDYNSASSQFFIVREDSKFLDSLYAGFGHVISGMEVVDQICEYSLEVVPDQVSGAVPADKQPKINSIRVVG